MAYCDECLRLMQDCLSNGKPLLLENIEEELDPMLDPVLEKRYIQQKRGLVLLLGDIVVCIIVTCRIR